LFLSDDGSYKAAGGGVNPTSGYIPYNNAGSFSDSPFNRTGVSSVEISNSVNSYITPLTFRNLDTNYGTGQGFLIPFYLSTQDVSEKKAFELSVSKNNSWTSSSDATSLVTFSTLYNGSEKYQLILNGSGSTVSRTPYGLTTNNPVLSGNGVVAANISSASTNIQQNSPSLMFQSSGWNSTNAASETVFAGSYLTPIQTSGAPSGEINFHLYTQNGHDTNLMSIGITYMKLGPVFWYYGSGSPSGVLTNAPVGSLYSRTDGGAATSLYVVETSAGSWVGK
jgi:hypothetical protein